MLARSVMIGIVLLPPRVRLLLRSVMLLAHVLPAPAVCLFKRKEKEVSTETINYYCLR